MLVRNRSIQKELEQLKKDISFDNSRILSQYIKQMYPYIVKITIPIFIEIVNQHGTRNSNHGYVFHMFSD
jgi:hypothetical protein